MTQSADSPSDAGAQSIDPDTVRRVARLARLALDEQHVHQYAAQLQSIVGYIDKVRRADVAGVEPMAYAERLCNVLRDDIVEPSLPLEKVLQNAPATDGPFFKVPKVLGGDEDSAG